MGRVRGRGLAGAWRGGGGRVRGRGLDCRLPAAQADCGAQDETRSVVCFRLHHQSLRLGVETADPQFPALQLSLPRGKALGASFFLSSQKQNFGMGKHQERGNPSTPFRTFLGRVLLECIMEREPQEPRREVPHSCTLGTLSEALTKLAYSEDSPMFVKAKNVSSFLGICSVPQICSTNLPAPPWPGLDRGAAVQQEPGSKDPRPGVRLAGSCSQRPGWEMGQPLHRRHAMPG